MKQNKLALVALVVLSILVLSEPAFAGPGGKIASAAFESFWGRIGLFILTIIFLPIIIYVYMREKRAEQRTRKDLRFMSMHSSDFEWLKIQERLKDCFFRIHSGWDDEDLSSAKEWMTDWYWQNQQLVHLERWKRDGLKNVCDVKKISYIKPLLFVHRNRGQEHEDSMVVISVRARMKDYLQNINTGKVVEGSKRYKEVNTIWSLTLNDGQWRVSNIDAGSMSLAYAKVVKDLPDIQSTLISSSRV
ncbi:Tim44-like domain-containing protein [Saccharospirillum sp. HFRX-1]|uniref:Tim44 domain-containing protein n=1 Tax=unclassified Saccharospirillum TaxID=2633430 RepID=UPI0037204AF2